MIDLTNKKFLETKFAEDFASPFYPMLADMYLLEGDLTRAKKVCEVGLDHDSTNVDGKYILGKVAVAENKLTLAEKWLKQVVNENPAHFTALRLLINVEIQLKRGVKTIQAYINHVLQFIPHDEECLKWLNEINASGDLVDSKTLPDSAAQKTTEPVVDKSYEVVESMATFTMVGVLKSQKHFHQALAVLEILKSGGGDGERISGERAEIQQLIKDSIK
jgi:lipopolysaccharide biosynthesis regulator YciM